MKYPDGSELNVGDLIWWNEGNCVGYIQTIAEKKKESEFWGCDHPHVFFTNIHPFDPLIIGGVAHDEFVFEDEGIGKLTNEEKKLFEKALGNAKIKSKTGFEGKSFSVRAHAQNGKMIK